MLVLNPPSGKGAPKMLYGTAKIPTDGTAVSIRSPARISSYFVCVKLYISARDYYLPFFNDTSPHKYKYDADGDVQISKTDTALMISGQGGATLEYWIFA